MSNVAGVEVGGASFPLEDTEARRRIDELQKDFLTYADVNMMNISKENDNIIQLKKDGLYAAVKEVSLNWQSLEGKPFEDIGNFLKSDNKGVLNVTNITPDWLEGKSYKINDIVLYKNKLYKKKNNDNSLISFANLDTNIFTENTNPVATTNEWLFDYGGAAQFEKDFFRNDEDKVNLDPEDVVFLFIKPGGKPYNTDGARWLVFIRKHSGVTKMGVHGAYNANTHYSERRMYSTYEDFLASPIGNYNIQEQKIKDILKYYDFFECMSYSRDAVGYGEGGLHLNTMYQPRFFATNGSPKGFSQIVESFINQSQVHSIYPDASPNWELLPYLTDEILKLNNESLKDVPISQTEGNIIEKKKDGIYATAKSLESDASGNILFSGDIQVTIDGEEITISSLLERIKALEEK